MTKQTKTPKKCIGNILKRSKITTISGICIIFVVLLAVTCVFSGCSKKGG